MISPAASSRGHCDMRSTQNELTSSVHADWRGSRHGEAVALAKNVALFAAAILGVMTASCGDSPSSADKRSGDTAPRSTPHSAANPSETAPACRHTTRELGRGLVAVLNAAKAGPAGPVFIRGRYVRVDTAPPAPPAQFRRGAYVVSAWVRLAGVSQQTWVVNRRMLTTGRGAALALGVGTQDASEPRALPSPGRQSRYADAIMNTDAYAVARACLSRTSATPGP